MNTITTLIERRHSPIHGDGLFAAQNIPAHCRLLEYMGERIDRPEAERRDAAGGITYIVAIDDAHFIDGAVGGNDSRYVNHSCDPNCTFVRQDLRVFLTTRRAIRADEELTLDYAFDKDQPTEHCRCRSPLCRGTINER